MTCRYCVFSGYPEKRTGVAYYDPVNIFKIKDAKGEVAQAFEYNLNEENIGECEIVNNSVEMRFTKWQIKAYRVNLSLK